MVVTCSAWINLYCVILLYLTIIRYFCERYSNPFRSYYNKGMQCNIGAVEAVYPDRLEVRITRHSACSSCHARGACTSSDLSESVIEVRDFPAGICRGDRVRIFAKSGYQGLYAVFFAFVLPLFLILVSIFLSHRLLWSDMQLLLVLVGLLLLYAFSCRF